MSAYNPTKRADRQTRLGMMLKACSPPGLPPTLALPGARLADGGNYPFLSFDSIRVISLGSFFSHAGKTDYNGRKKGANC